MRDLSTFAGSVQAFNCDSTFFLSFIFFSYLNQVISFSLTPFATILVSSIVYKDTLEAFINVLTCMVAHTTTPYFFLVFFNILLLNLIN